MPNEFLNLAHIQGIGHEELNGDSATAKMRPGSYSFMVDDFGTRVFMYGRNIKASAAMSQGELVNRAADVAVTNLTSGTTTSATKGATWTADRELGKLLYVQDNDDAAGGAPEGEVSVIVRNTAGLAVVDANYPYSVALAVNDDLDTISPGWHWIAGAVGNAQEVKGVIVGSGGIANGNYGWAQCYGICPIVNLKVGTGFTDRAAIIADTSAIAPDANGGWELVIGHSLGTVTSDIVSDKAPAFINVFTPTLNAGTP